MPLLNYPDDYDCYAYDERTCPDCEERQDDLDRAKECFDLIIKMLHGREMINPDTLGMLLEDVSSYCGFDCDFPKHLPTVQVVSADPMTVYPVNKELLK